MNYLADEPNYAVDGREEAKTGRILNIQRMSTEDGPGIRTTVFVKGCSLACVWCHNPESIAPKPQVQWIENRCIGCGSCLKACPQGALTSAGSGICIERRRCRGCGQCSEACPSGALEMLGKRWDVETLAREVEKDRAYFENSGGGITVSGGEPTVQASFVGAFLRECQKRGLHTALDTCGMCAFESLELVLEACDLVLYDLKEIDAQKHRRFTGRSNDIILENLKALSAYIKAHDKPKELWIRTPVIPGMTATDENMHGIGAFIAQHLGEAVTRWELCAFNNLCKDKYRRLGISWQFKDTQLLTKDQMNHFLDVAQKSGVNPRIALWTGATQTEA